ncbi:phenylalanine--tRNA ligase subunit beta [Granulicella sibirica]|uniref:Phenylalanine--tRNA ligase beta subunit n=1 Tax=Granulicella sibirica TaxID=2479048 RepID=A0A4Q0T9J8_9BACT|nr:phenylalanine--tRNA ligase subunit beta [Granulicella sibirica]RXH58788.1 Phenylalanyl-tRNA synthetase beta chain [Granulicella sibirica]
MKILTHWLRTFLPTLPVDDRQLADDLTLRGIAVEGVHLVAGGSLFEMDITTNRVDAMNHYGIAREAATIYNLPLAPLDTALPNATAAAPFPVRISPEAEALCGRFTARVLRDVTIAPSTGRISEYFGSLGQKQISNAVDASNFVLLAMGHPTHAFDLDKIHGGIVVRLARAGESLRLLDGTTRTLAADDLVVADETKALGLAGVMGGWDSMITPQTKNVLVEAAWFDQASVRRSARRHGLHTDASHRFERGADIDAAPVANALVSQLILHLGGYVAGELIDLRIPAVDARTSRRPRISLSVAEVQRHLGTTLAPEGITREIVEQYLKSLGCDLFPSGGDTFEVQLPSWRLDLEREIDLVEEVARVYGYNGFANTLPMPLPVIELPVASAERAVRQRLLALGFSESISSTFASESDAALFFEVTQDKGTIPMENPLSEEASLLRPTLVPGMLTMLAHNLNRDVRAVRLFEQGQIFTGSTDLVDEQPSLTLGLTGASAATSLYSAQDAPFFELKGTIESILSLFAANAVTPGESAAAALAFTTTGLPGWLEPGRSAVAHLGSAPVAWFGELAKGEAARRKLRQPVFLAEVDLAKLYALPLRHVAARELSRFQAVERDFSFTFPDVRPWSEIEASLRGLDIPALQSLKPTEIFRDRKGKSVPLGHYALLIRAVFQSNERTLSEAELTDWWSAIISALTSLGGVIRAPEEATQR